MLNVYMYPWLHTLPVTYIHYSTDIESVYPGYNQFISHVSNFSLFEGIELEILGWPVKYFTIEPSLSTKGRNRKLIKNFK